MTNVTETSAMSFPFQTFYHTLRLILKGVARVVMRKYLEISSPWQLHEVYCGDKDRVIFKMIFRFFFLSQTRTKALLVNSDKF